MNLSALLTESSQAANAQGNMLFTFLPLVVIVVIFYFMLIRPQKKRELFPP